MRTIFVIIVFLIVVVSLALTQDYSTEFDPVYQEYEIQRKELLKSIDSNTSLSIRDKESISNWFKFYFDSIITNPDSSSIAKEVSRLSSLRKSIRNSTLDSTLEFQISDIQWILKSYSDSNSKSSKKASKSAENAATKIDKNEKAELEKIMQEHETDINNAKVSDIAPKGEQAKKYAKRVAKKEAKKVDNGSVERAEKEIEYDSVAPAPALYSAVNSLFRRDIIIIVLKKNQNYPPRPDTICANVIHYKDIPGMEHPLKQEFTSSQCNTNRYSVSTGQNHVFIVETNNKSHPFKRAIPSGRNSNDLYYVTLIIE